MDQGHFVRKLKANSPYIGQGCPVRRTPLQPGDAVVICQQSNVAVTLDSWRETEREWGGRCPHCGEAVALSELFPDVLLSPKPPLPAPEYSPTRPDGRQGLNIVAVAIGAIVLAFVGLASGAFISGTLFQKATSPALISSNLSHTPTPSRTPTPSLTSSPFTTPGSSRTPTPSRTPTATATSISREAEREEVQQVIRVFDDIKKDAVGPYYDDSQLTTVLGGQALDEQEGSVKWLSTCNAYYEITLHAMVFESFKFSSPGYATVIVKKEESRTYYQRGQNPKSTPRDIYRVSYDLQQIGGRWYIVSKGVIDEQTGFTPTPRPPSSKITCQ